MKCFGDKIPPYCVVLGACREFLEGERDLEVAREGDAERTGVLERALFVLGELDRDGVICLDGFLDLGDTLEGVLLILGELDLEFGREGEMLERGDSNLEGVCDDCLRPCPILLWGVD